MDTNDLKDLFNEQRGASRLTASGVTQHVRLQQALRRAVAAGFVTLAVVGASLGGVWLNSQNTDTVPAEPLPSPSVTPVTPPSPTPVADPTSVVSEVGGTTRPLATGVECTVDAPVTWRELIENPDADEVAGPWLEHQGNVVTWHDDGQGIQIAIDADPMYGGGTTDGRFVIYLTGTQLKVWDSANPEEPAWAIDGDFGGDTPGGGGLHEGLLWITQYDDWALPAEDRVTKVSVINLVEGRDAKLVLEEKGVEVFSSWGGYLQVRYPGGPARLIDAEGAFVEMPAEFEDRVVVGQAGGVTLLTTHLMEEPRRHWLYSDGELREVEGFELAGEWLMGEGPEGVLWLENIYSGVRVNLPAAEMGYSFDDGHLKKLTGPEGPDREIVELADLPEVACP